MGILIAAPFLLVMVLFALSNPQLASLHIWPTDLSLDAPLSLVVLVGMGLGFLMGAFMLWFTAVFARMRARRAESALRRTEQQLVAARAQLEALKPVAASASSSSSSTAMARAPGTALAPPG